MAIKYIIDGDVVSGSTDTATSIHCKDAEGKDSNVQKELDKQNQNFFDIHQCDVISDYATNPIYFYKKGNNKLIYINGLKNITQETLICLCDVPDGYAPEFTFKVENSDVGGSLYRIQIASGKLYIYYYGSPNHAGNLVNVFYYF